LFGLKTLAEDEDGRLPEIFTESNYKKINQSILYTSTMTTPALRFGGLAPATTNGYAPGG
jgi:hypothetical protein